ncbi:hypothetical protein NNO_1303 [Hydrogenimonas sp.]|nr:hypothetical protein NNO_1303 [Hydrogenimonas sp.]
MSGYREFFISIVLLSLLTGCSKNAVMEKERFTAPVKRVHHEAPKPLPSPETHRNGESVLYAKAEGKSEEEAKKRAVSILNRQIWSEFYAKIDSGEYGSRRVLRYISKEELKSAKRLFKKIPLSRYRVKSSKSLDNGMVAVTVEIERKDMAATLKKSTISKLVSIEERWHSARESSITERFALSKESFGKMRSLLPEYLLAGYISPFPSAIVGRVEKSLPYFRKTAKRLKKRLKFSVEPVSSPAMRLFADAMERVLKRERLISTGEAGADGRTLCITLEGNLMHKLDSQKHIFEATLKITVHERFKAPLSTQLYRVRGVSEESGTKALERAAVKLQKELEKRFFENV